jgi:hypothetical protein
MELIIKCTADEQTQFKQNIKINDNDTAIIIKVDKPEDMTSGEYFLSLVEWRIT